MEVKELDISTFNKKYVDLKVPAIIITKPTDALVPVLKSCMYDGEVSLVLEVKGERKLVRKISESAYNMISLLKVSSGIIFVDEERKEHNITCISDYLEVFESWT